MCFSVHVYVPPALPTPLPNAFPVDSVPGTELTFQAGEDNPGARQHHSPLMLLTSPEPPELLLPLLEPPLPSSSSLARTTPAKGMTATYATSLAPHTPYSRGLGSFGLWGHHGPWPIGIELYFPVEMAKWEGRGSRRTGGLGRREQLPTEFPWAWAPVAT